MSSKGCLYVGIDPRHYKTHLPIYHMPLMEIVPRALASREIQETFRRVLKFTHIVFTSKSAVRIFFDYFKKSGHTLSELKNTYIIAIGQVPAFYLKEEGVIPSYVTSDEAQTGVVRVLSALDLEEVNILLPRSSSMRPQLAHFLVEHDIHHQICTLYDAHKKRPTVLPDLEMFEEVVFTTPTVIEAFFDLFETIPEELNFHPIGFYSREALRKVLHEKRNTDLLQEI